MHQFNARMIDHGQVIKVASFEVDKPEKAYAVAHDGIDPLSGAWVEVRPVPEKKQSGVDNEK